MLIGTFTVSTFLKLGMEREIVLLNCFFYTKAKHSHDFQDLRKWTKGIKIFSKHYLFVPIHDK